MLINVSPLQGASVHPGLYPILTLLSRLHPSVMDGSDQVTAMSAFVPLVMTCAVSSIYKVCNDSYSSRRCAHKDTVDTRNGSPCIGTLDPIE